MKQYQGVFMPFFLRLTNTIDVNEKDEERKESVYQHKSSSDTFHLLTDEEIKRDKDE